MLLPLNMAKFLFYFFTFSLLGASPLWLSAKATFGTPRAENIEKPFDASDLDNFKNPPKENYPHTWFHYIGGNVSVAGITRDLQAIADAGIRGVQLFHGEFKDNKQWSKVEPEISCMSPLWESAVKHTAEECRRLGLDFAMQNCPGWAMAGGPWNTAENAMRDIVASSVQVDKNSTKTRLPMPAGSGEQWRDYREICVLAFPSPIGDFKNPIKTSYKNGTGGIDWNSMLEKGKDVFLPQTKKNEKYFFEIEIPQGEIVRTLEMTNTRTMNSRYVYEPDISISLTAIFPDGTSKKVLETSAPQGTWQEEYPLQFSCSEAAGASRYRFEIANPKFLIKLKSVKLYSAAFKNCWRSEAGWTLRSIDRSGDKAAQNSDAYVKFGEIVDISEKLSADGTLDWRAPDDRKWTVMRFGHVNKGRKNHPAPPSGTGWECDKFSKTALEKHFNGYIGKLNNGALKGGLLDSMLLDSWECQTQTWTKNMREEFAKSSGYDLTRRLPAIFGYVIDSQESTSRFLLDWRKNINVLFVNNFFGEMSRLAKKNNLTLFYETAAIDIFPADIFEYYKFADIPMCEFWSPMGDSYVGSVNFKPIKPAASAARIYGKPRVSAEAFTSFELTWDEHWQMWREIANFNMAEGVTHLVFHTYTHNPQVDFLPPGTSFANKIGSPMLRGQTWWKHMPELTTYFARCSYMLERGKNVSDILWYMGDELRHKPDQNFKLPQGFKYDYCNFDGLINRISAADGILKTPDGVEYKALWITDNRRMRIESLEKIRDLLEAGATVIGSRPVYPATLSGGKAAEEKFKNLADEIWGDAKKGLRKVGKGKVLAGMAIDEAIDKLGLKPRVKNSQIIWSQRRVDGADIFFVCAPKGGSFKGNVEFLADCGAEVWDPTTGKIEHNFSQKNGEYASVPLDLPNAASRFVVFAKGGKYVAPKSPNAKTEEIAMEKPWKIEFPQGWGIDKPIFTNELKAWKDLDLSAEGKAFSGTAKYSATFIVDKIDPKKEYSLHLGKVDMIAEVSVNGKKIATLWCEPYKTENISEYLKSGKNELQIEVTSTWFNRLVYDQSLPEKDRKTWTMFGPQKNEKLRESGLLGDVKIISRDILK